jgi:hypothetical protein
VCQGDLDLLTYISTLSAFDVLLALTLFCLAFVMLPIDLAVNFDPISERTSRNFAQACASSAGKIF